MNPGTAANRLRKNLMFAMSKQLGVNWCYQCGAEIENPQDMPIEHKQPWMGADNPHDAFFDLSNIAFSHPNCNYAASWKGRVKPCPSTAAYRRGCRCEGCIKAKAEYRKKKREVKKKSLGR